jgi:hypothetical protein
VVPDYQSRITDYGSLITEYVVKCGAWRMDCQMGAGWGMFRTASPRLRRPFFALRNVCEQRMVGAGRFELPTFWSQTRRANQTALRPDLLGKLRIPTKEGLNIPVVTRGASQSQWYLDAFEPAHPWRRRGPRELRIRNPRYWLFSAPSSYVFLITANLSLFLVFFGCLMKAFSQTA